MYSHRLPAVGLLALLLAPALPSDAKEIEALAGKIDQRIAAGWGSDVKPAPRADDAEYFRRVHLDLTGRIPTIAEVRDFLDDDRPDKRRLWVDRILQADPDDASYREAYAAHFANVWRAWLLTQTNQQALLQQPALELWLRQRLKANAGYDQLVRDLLTQQAGGPQPPGIQGIGPADGSPAAYFQANEFRPENIAGSTARLFLGVKLECAQCHDHPFDKWSRDQFWEYAAFFTDLPQQGRPNQPAAARMPRGAIKVLGTEKVVQARFLDGKEPQWKDAGTRPTLVEWMTAPDNPLFAKAAVNRMWVHFFGVGLVDQSDGPGDQNPAGYTELLDDLARAFVAHKYDVKFLIRTITASATYQRASTVTDDSQKDLSRFARMPLRGLSPEQLFDSLAVATEYQDAGLSDPLIAIRGNPQAPRAQFLAKFVAQEQKTDYQTSILQALYLMNNEFIAERTSVKNNRTLATFAEQRTSTARKVESLYLVVLSRKPRADESERLIKYVDSGGAAGDPKKALGDVFWVLLNSPEFLLNH